MRWCANDRIRRIAVIFIILSVIQMAGTYGWFTSGVPLIGFADAKNDGDNGNSGGGSGGGNAGGNSGGGSGGGNAGGNSGGGGGNSGGNSGGGSGGGNAGGNSGGGGGNSGGNSGGGSGGGQGQGQGQGSGGGQGQGQGQGSGGGQGQGQGQGSGGGQGQGQGQGSGGGQVLVIDLNTARSAGEKISVQENTIRFEHGTYTITVKTKDTPREDQGELSGEIESITLQGTPVKAQYTGKGAVSASFGADLKTLPVTGATVTASLIEKPDDQSRAAFERAAEENGFAVDSVAYAMKVDKSGLEDGRDVGRATVTMTVSPAWVLEHGGFSGIQIARFADDGSSEILASSFNGIDADSNMVFTGTSPRGLSIFALISIKAQDQPVAPQPVTMPSKRSDASATMVFIPPILLFAALFLIRKT